MISLPPRVRGLVDDRREPIAVVVLLVNAVAVGRFDQQVVRLGHRRRIRQHRPAEAPEVPAEQDRPAVDTHADVGRPEQVAGVDELDFDAWRDRHRPLVADRLQLRDRAHRVHFAIQRQRRRVLRRLVPIGELGILFLDPPGVGQGRCGRDPGCPACRRRAREILARPAAAGSRSDRDARASGRSPRYSTPGSTGPASCEAAAPSIPGTARRPPSPACR